MDIDKLAQEIKAYGGPEMGAFFLIPKTSINDNNFEIVSQFFNIHSPYFTANIESMHEEMWDKKVIPYIEKKYNFSMDDFFNWFFDVSISTTLTGYPFPRGIVDIVKKNGAIEYVNLLVPTQFLSYNEDIIDAFSLYEVRDKIIVRSEWSESYDSSHGDSKFFKTVLFDYINGNKDNYKKREVKNIDYARFETLPKIKEFASLSEEIIKKSYYNQRPKFGGFFIVPKTIGGKNEDIITDIEDNNARSWEEMSDRGPIHGWLWVRKVIPYLIKTFNISKEKISIIENEFERCGGEPFPFPRGRVEIFQDGCNEFDIENLDDTKPIIPEFIGEVLIDIDSNDGKLTLDIKNKIISIFNLHEVKDKIKIRIHPQIKDSEKVKKVFEDVVTGKYKEPKQQKQVDYSQFKTLPKLKEFASKQIDYSKFITEKEFGDMMEVIQSEKEIHGVGYFVPAFQYNFYENHKMLVKTIPILLENRDSIQLFTIPKTKLKPKSKFYSYSRLFTSNAPNGDANICFAVDFDKITKEISKTASKTTLEEKYDVKISDLSCTNGTITNDTIKAVYKSPELYSGLEDDGWDESNSVVLGNINNFKGSSGSGKASAVLEAMKDLAKENNKVVLLHPYGPNVGQLKDWYKRHGFRDVGDYWIWKL